MRILWINEELTPPDKEYTQIFGFEDFKTDIDYNGLPDEIWFCAKTGYECAEYLVKYCSENNYATPRYHLEQMKLEDARKIIYLIEDYNLNYIREHGISEKDLLNHFVEIIGNTHIDSSITYAINKHDKEIEALSATIANDKNDETDDKYNSILEDISTQFTEYDKTIKDYIKLSKFVKEYQIPTKLSQLENDEGYLKEQQDVSKFITKEDMPTKVSQLENDEGYLKEHQDISSLVTKTELNNKLFVKANKNDLINKANYSDIPKKVSQLENDSNFVTSVNVPSKVSQLENDSKFATKNDINNKADKNFVLEALVDYATMRYVRTKFDDIINNYIMIKKPETLEDGNYKLVVENGNIKLVKEI